MDKESMNSGNQDPTGMSDTELTSSKEGNGEMEQSSITIPETQVIKGKITKVITSRALVVQGLDSGNLFHITLNKPYPTAEGDIIISKVKNHDPKTREVVEASFKVLYKPIIIPGEDEDTLRECFTEALKNCRMRDKGKYISNLLQWWRNKKGRNEVSHRLMSRAEYEMSKSCVIYNRLKGKPRLSGFENDDYALSYLFRWWFKHRLQRRLQLLELDVEEVLSNKLYESYNVPWIAESNPYKLPFLDSNTVEEIASNCCDKPPGDYPLLCHDIVKQLYYHLLDGHLDYPLSRILNELELSESSDLPLDTLPQYGINYSTHNSKYVVFTEVNNARRKLAEVFTYIKCKSREILDDRGDEPIYERLGLTVRKKDNNISSEQLKVLELLDTQPLSVITGGPGTGKTTTIAYISNVLESMGITYLVLAYTGKAVSKLKSLGVGQISTIHRAMLADVPTVLIFDEASMIDYRTLVEYFCCGDATQPIRELDSVKALMFVGDPNQLPPIGWGRVLNTILKTVEPPINSTLFKHLYLTTQYRCGDAIVDNALRFLEGRDFKTHPKFKYIPGDIDDVVDMYKKLIKAKVGPEQIVILSPYVKESSDINERIIEFWLKNKDSTLDSRGRSWYSGLKVMMLRNDYQIDIMNGEEGVITHTDDDSIYINFDTSADPDDNIGPNDHQFLLSHKEYGRRTTDAVSACYALTIHKCLSPSTRIWTPKGNVSLEYLFNKSRIGMRIASMGRELYKEVKSIVLSHEKRDTLKLKLSLGILVECTPNHSWLGSDGLEHKGVQEYNLGIHLQWRKAQDFIVGNHLLLKVGIKIRVDYKLDMNSYYKGVKGKSERIYCPYSYLRGFFPQLTENVKDWCDTAKVRLDIESKEWNQYSQLLLELFISLGMFCYHTSRGLVILRITSVPSLYLIKILEISRSSSVVYDVEMKGSEKYFLANSIVSHNSQGSEWDFVLLYLPRFSDFISRRLIYTAMTRTKKGFCLIGSRDAYKKASFNVDYEVGDFTSHLLSKRYENEA